MKGSICANKVNTSLLNLFLATGEMSPLTNCLKLLASELILRKEDFQKSCIARPAGENPDW